MKPYETYQRIPGDSMTSRDHQQVGSKFWNEGKWNNFVAPHLPKDCSGLGFVDMGCNAGLFLKFAQDRGFSHILGVESNKGAYLRGKDWAIKNNAKYTILRSTMEKANLPIVDYTVLANAHYYFHIIDWLDYIERLKFKTRYVIIVTAEKNHINHCWARADIASLRRYFKEWKEVSFVDELPTVGDPDPRRMWSICFESPMIERVEVDKLTFHNHVQDNFYKELDSGKHYKDTGYYRVLKKYRAKWGEDVLHAWIEDKIKTYEDIKKNGQFKPILYDEKFSILDGNHRGCMLKNLGHTTVFGRRI